MSRQIYFNLEWTSAQYALDLLCADENTGTPSIDLFASCLNNTLLDYVPLHPDAAAQFIKAFIFKWKEFIYLFPTFNLIGGGLS